jgi:hypothetical protein
MSTRLVTVAAATAGIVLASSGWAQTSPAVTQASPQVAAQTATQAGAQDEKPRTIVDLFKRMNKNSTPARSPLTVQRPIDIPPPGQMVAPPVQQARPAPQAQQARPAPQAQQARPVRTQASKPRRVQTAKKKAPAAAPVEAQAAWSPDAPLPAALAVADTLAITEILRADRLKAEAVPAAPPSNDPATRRLDDAFGAIATFDVPADVVPMTTSTPSTGAGVMHLLSYAAPEPDVSETASLEATAVATYAPPSEIQALIDKAAAENGVPADLARGLVAVLSSYNPQARGKSGEIGLMQLMPQTAQAMGFTGSANDLYDPEINLTYGMRYLAKAYELGGGSTCQAVHKYTAGHFAKGMTSASTRFCTKVQTAMRQ